MTIRKRTRPGDDLELIDELTGRTVDVTIDASRGWAELFDVRLDGFHACDDDATGVIAIQPDGVWWWVRTPRALEDHHA